MTTIELGKYDKNKFNTAIKSAVYNPDDVLIDTYNIYNDLFKEYKKDCMDIFDRNLYTYYYRLHYQESTYSKFTAKFIKQINDINLDDKLIFQLCSIVPITTQKIFETIFIKTPTIKLHNDCIKTILLNYDCINTNLKKSYSSKYMNYIKNIVNILNFLIETKIINITPELINKFVSNEEFYAILKYIIMDKIQIDNNDFEIMCKTYHKQPTNSIMFDNLIKIMLVNGHISDEKIIILLKNTFITDDILNIIMIYGFNKFKYEHLCAIFSNKINLSKSIIQKIYDNRDINEDQYILILNEALSNNLEFVDIILNDSNIKPDLESLYHLCQNKNATKPLVDQLIKMNDELKLDNYCLDLVLSTNNLILYEYLITKYNIIPTIYNVNQIVNNLKNCDIRNMLNFLFEHKKTGIILFDTTI